MLIDEGLELLDETQCRELLSAGTIGRVAITIGALPAIFPVNYAYLDGDILFRTAPGSKLAAATQHAVVAFEVDDYDTAERTGWSVLVVGRAEVVHDLDVTFKALELDLEPWAWGTRTSIVRISPEVLSGRRIIREDDQVPEEMPTNGSA